MLFIDFSLTYLNIGFNIIKITINKKSEQFAMRSTYHTKLPLNPSIKMFIREITYK